MPGCTRRSAFKATRDITSGMRRLVYAPPRRTTFEVLVFPRHKNQEHPGP